MAGLAAVAGMRRDVLSWGGCCEPRVPSIAPQRSRDSQMDSGHSGPSVVSGRGPVTSQMEKMCIKARVYGTEKLSLQQPLRRQHTPPIRIKDRIRSTEGECRGRSKSAAHVQTQRGGSKVKTELKRGPLEERGPRTDSARGGTREITEQIGKLKFKQKITQ